ncbi:hypothetical protein ACIBQ6_12290 [Nonomuraea sp. NPDC049655]|uniref:hypothetical protein n=1 Tax=Nonomuraea sp. NPDC049655 TaxID=3364355 RepID=UPI0037B87A7D
MHGRLSAIARFEPDLVPEEQVLLEVIGADGLDSGGGEPGDQGVRVGDVRPELAALGEVVAQGFVGQLVERAGDAVEDDAPVGQVDAVEGELADGLWVSGVDRVQGDDQAQRRCDGGTHAR